MSILEQLRQKQKAAGLVADPETGAPVPGLFSHVGNSPKQESRGYCRIFPSDYPTLAAVPQSFKDEHWQKSSPWCKIDGEPEHPDFQKNLESIENLI